MKKLLLGGALVIMSAGAYAADMPAAMPYKAMPAAPFSWSGYYFGIHGGYGWGEHQSLAVANIALKPHGGFGGVQAGYNSMIAPNWLLGSEIQLSGGDIDNDRFQGLAGFTHTKIDFFGTALVRLGYTFDRTLLYAVGGVAWAQNKTEDTAGNFRINESRVGWTIGGGLEYAFAPNWSAKIEYLYADFGGLHATSAGALNYNASLTSNTVKFGLNYRFADAAAVAPMPVKAMPRAAYSWSGAYVGGNVSYVWGDANVSDIVGAGISTSFRPRDWNIGMQTGYNWVFAPNLLLGFETDNSFLDVKDDLPGAQLKITNAGTVRARLGYVNDRALIYGTGGLAYAKTKFNDVPNSNQLVGTYQIGWAAGGGVEYMLAPRWSAKLEYLYADYGRTHLLFTNLGDESRSSLKLQSVTAGLNYKFDLGQMLRGQ